MADYLHPDIPEAQLHNPKGFTTANASSLPSKDFNDALTWVRFLPRVISVADVASAPPDETTGNRYLLIAAGSAHANWDGAVRGQIAQFDGSVWVADDPQAGDMVMAQDGTSYRYNGSVWLCDGALHAVTSDTQIDERHSTVFVTAPSGNVTITLPNPADVPGHRYYVWRTATSLNTVTLARNGGENIDGAGSDKTIASTTRHIVVSDGTNWFTMLGA